MAILNIGLAKVGIAACKCGNAECVHGGADAAKRQGKPVGAYERGEWMPRFVEAPSGRDPRFTRKRHRRGAP